MNWMTPCLLVAGALVASGCSNACQGDDFDQPIVPTKITQGSGQLVLSCASLSDRVLVLKESSEYASFLDLEKFNRKLNVELYFATPPGVALSSLTMGILFDGDLQDGTHTMGPDAKSLNLSSAVGDYTVPTDYRGTLTFQRSRPVPLVDEKDPEHGSYNYTFDGTLALEGTMPAAAWPECKGPISFKLAPVSFHMEKNTSIVSCDLSGIRGGGH